MSDVNEIFVLCIRVEASVCVCLRVCVCCVGREREVSNFHVSRGQHSEMISGKLV